MLNISENNCLLHKSIIDNIDFDNTYKDLYDEYLSNNNFTFIYSYNLELCKLTQEKNYFIFESVLNNNISFDNFKKKIKETILNKLDVIFTDLLSDPYCYLDYNDDFIVDPSYINYSNDDFDYLRSLNKNNLYIFEDDFKRLFNQYCDNYISSAVFAFYKFNNDKNRKLVLTTMLEKIKTEDFRFLYLERFFEYIISISKSSDIVFIEEYFEDLVIDPSISLYNRGAIINKLTPILNYKYDFTVFVDNTITAYGLNELLRYFDEYRFG